MDKIAKRISTDYAGWYDGQSNYGFARINIGFLFGNRTL
ncbi:hypothetical protein LEP1GSC073_0593 [Leptospira noguchii str. Cascata]|nr:hypothetical protein LEP1GSC073_0593 [Leptospira noguchii str. Cascata]